MLFYACLWSIKLSFLLFFYRLGVSSIPKLHWHWWGVTVVTILCFLGCFAALPYYCSFGGKKALLTSYCSVEHNMSFLSMKVNCVLDVFTDLLSKSFFFFFFTFGARRRERECGIMGGGKEIGGVERRRC
jgi:hypothetical protein